MARCVLGVPLILLVLSLASAETPPQSDPQALTFATQSLLTNGTAIVDVTLSRNAIWTSGTNTESGTDTAYGKTDVDRRLDGRGLPHTTARRMPSIHYDNLDSAELFGTSAGSRPSVNHDVL
jgi:hypothetical protein